MSRPPAAGEESWLDRNRLSESPRRDWREEERAKSAARRCESCLEDDVEIGEDGLCERCHRKANPEEEE